MNNNNYTTNDIGEMLRFLILLGRATAPEEAIPQTRNPIILQALGEGTIIFYITRMPNTYCFNRISASNILSSKS